MNGERTRQLRLNLEWKRETDAGSFYSCVSTDEKRHKNVAVHCSPAFRVEVGDVVTVGQCRPLSKTVR